MIKSMKFNEDKLKWLLKNLLATTTEESWDVDMIVDYLHFPELWCNIPKIILKSKRYVERNSFHTECLFCV